MSRKDDHNKKENIYRDVFHVWDEDLNCAIDKKDCWNYTNRQKVIAERKKECDNHCYCDAEEDGVYDLIGNDDCVEQNTKDVDNVWRYYDEWHEWNYAQALIDNFSELAEDYIVNNHSILSDIILETYEIDKPRAVLYLKWLWKTFTPDLFINEKDTPYGTESFKSRGEIIMRLIFANYSCDCLYNLLKNDTDFLIAGFIDCRHEKHNLDFVKAYIGFMLKRLDVDAIIDAYNYYLKGQKGRYTDKDLGNLWNDIAFGVFYSGINNQEKFDTLERFIPFIECLGVRSKKPLDRIAKYQKELKELLDGGYLYDKDEYAEILQLRNTDYWAVDFSQDSPIYDYCQVAFVNFKNIGLYYFTNGIDVCIGDEVVVPFGGDNKEELAIVVSVGKCYANAFGFSVARIKNIIKKIDK